MPQDPRFQADDHPNFTPDAPSGGAASRFFGNLVDSVNPIPALKEYLLDAPEKAQRDVATKIHNGDYSGAVYSAVKNSVYSIPGIKMLVDVAHAQLQQLGQVVPSLQNTKDMPALSDRLMIAGGHALAGALPVLGPASAKAGEQIGNGDVAGGLGRATGLIGSVLAPEVARTVLPKSIPVSPNLTRSLDPAEQSAVQFAKDNGIPLDAATQSGSPVIRNIQGVVQNSVLGSGPAKAARMAQTDAIRTVGGNLADQISKAQTNPELAGQGVSDTLATNAKDLSAQADTAYGKLRQIEADPENLKTIQTGAAQQVPVRSPNGSIVGMNSVPQTKQIALPVDLTKGQKTLQTVYGQLTKLMPVAQQRASVGMTAIKNVLDSDPVISASEADTNLSALKAAQREMPNPAAARLLNMATDQLSKAVDTAVSGAGPDAFRALQEGRALTKAKYATLDAAEQLRTEPVQLFNQLTYAKDSGIDLLRNVAEKAPTAIPAVGRAYVEGLLDSATAPAGMARPQSALTAWSKLGPATKQVLFEDPALIKNLDDFFTLVKKVGENPNPSGSGYVAQLGVDGGLVITSPHLGIPYVIGKGALARILYSPKGSAALVRGARIPVGNTAASALTANQILSLAGQDAQPLTVPAQRTGQYAGQTATQ